MAPSQSTRATSSPSSNDQPLRRFRTPGEVRMIKHRARAHAIAEKIRLLRLGHDAGVPVSGMIELSWSGYDDLISLLTQHEALDFAYSDLKLSYNLYTNQLTFERPTVVHGCMASRLTEDFTLKMMSVSDGCSFSYLPYKGGRIADDFHPDGVWEYSANPTSRAELRCFALEVCYSCRAFAAEPTIQATMRLSREPPGLVLLVQIEYASPTQLMNPPPLLNRTASYSVFQRTQKAAEGDIMVSHVTATIRERKFRDIRGTVVPGQLSLLIRDIIGLENYDSIPNRDDPRTQEYLDQAIVLEHSELAGWLEEAEERAVEAELVRLFPPKETTPEKETSMRNSRDPDSPLSSPRSIKVEHQD